MVTGPIRISIVASLTDRLGVLFRDPKELCRTRAGSFWLALTHRGVPGAALSKAQSAHAHVDQLDADERHDDATQAVDQQVAAQQRCGADGTVADALQRQR